MKRNKHENTNNKKVAIVILILDNSIMKDKVEHFIMIKVLTHQKDITIMFLFWFNI